MVDASALSADAANCGQQWRSKRLGQIWLQQLFDRGLIHRLATIQAVENLLQYLFGLVAFAVQQKAVEDVLPAHRIGNFGFLVVFAQFGEIHDFVASR